MSWRLLDTGASPGYYNLALDEALFVLAREGKSRPAVRFYSWSVPAVSVGYFQRWRRQLDAGACRERGLDIYRRITGGRAVLHREEVTYSVVCGDSTSFFGEGIWPAYRRIARALVAGLRGLGVEAELVRPAPRGQRRDTPPHPSCFSAGNGYEISAGGEKLVGSAQKRQGRALLQHGSVLLADHGRELEDLLLPGARSSVRRPGMASLERLSGRRPAVSEVVEALAEGFRREWAVSLTPAEPTAEERIVTGELIRSKYLSGDWNGSGPPGPGETAHAAGA